MFTCFNYWNLLILTIVVTIWRMNHQNCVGRASHIAGAGRSGANCSTGYSRPGISEQSSKLTTSLLVDSKPTGLYWHSEFLSINEYFWSDHFCWQRFFMRLMTNDLKHLWAMCRHFCKMFLASLHKCLVTILIKISNLDDNNHDSLTPLYGWMKKTTNMKSLFWIIPQIERESFDLNGWTQAKTLTTECDSYLTCTVLVCTVSCTVYSTPALQ